MRPHVLLAAWLVVFCMHQGVSAEDSALANLKGKFRQAEAQIQADSVKQQQEALNAYAKGIESLALNLKQKGDLDGFLHAEKEKARFAAGKVVDLTRTNDPFLSSVVTVYARQVAEVNQSAGQRKVVLLGQYVAALESLLKTTMVANRIDEAKIINSELEKARSQFSDCAGRLPAPAGQKPAESAPVEPAAAQSAPGARPVMLQAKPVRTKNDAVRKKEILALNIRHDAMNPNMTWSSAPVEVDFIYASQTVEVTVKPVGSENLACDLEVVFFVDNRETGETESQKPHKEKLDLQPGETVVKRITSPEARYTRQSRIVDGEKKEIGVQPCGYVVALTDASGPFKWQVSPELARRLRTVEDVTRALKAKKLE